MAIAVSGGADSLALAYLTAPWARKNGRPLTALIVDHGLRPESGMEAEATGSVLSRMGIANETLRWYPGELTGSVQARAREARYELLRARCRMKGVRELLLAHHLDDQAETFLLRISAGSGVSGLAAMRVRTSRQGIEIVRPLLRMQRARLRATLREVGISWKEDPSNDDPRHERTRIRRLFAARDCPLPSPTLFGKTANVFAKLDDALRSVTHHCLAAHISVSPLGTISLERAPIQELPEPLAQKALATAVQAVSGRPYPPRSRQIAPLVKAIVAKGTGKRTLAGVLAKLEKERVTLIREKAAIAAPISLGPGETAWWDGRFRVENRDRTTGVRVGMLGTQGLGELRETLPKNVLADHPRAVLLALPAFRGLDGLMSTPHLHWWKAPAQSGSFGAEFDPPVAPPGWMPLPVVAPVRQDEAGSSEGRI